MILIGASRLRRSRVDAYRWFMRGILVNIFVTQVFVFFESELRSMGGLVISILIYVALTFMIEREKALAMSFDDQQSKREGIT